jgi:REP-associated tyrosine transposase
MPKIERNITINSVHHVYNRAIDKKIIFCNESDYGWFLSKIEYYKEKFKIKLYAFAILPNHFHLLIQESEVMPGIVPFMNALCLSYSKYFNIRHDRKGSLFESRFKSKLVEDDDYMYMLIYYINNNPVKHGLVERSIDWDYSSYYDYYNSSYKNCIIDKNPWVEKEK